MYCAGAILIAISKAMKGAGIKYFPKRFTPKDIQARPSFSARHPKADSHAGRGERR